VPWGQKALPRYLGADPLLWRRCDTVCLLQDGHRSNAWLVDQGELDPFLLSQLRPDLLEEACLDAAQSLTLRRHEGYDHGYYFIQTVIDDHLDHHFQGLA
jgi:S-formylglutathione hydrolase